MNIEQARINMIKQQIRACDVLDESLLELLKQTPREFFVPQKYKNLAFSDTNIPIGHHETMLTPRDEALLLDALKIKKSDKVLEVGTGSGYITALLAQLAKQVTTIDIIREFTHAAKNKLNLLSFNNVDFITADASRGWDENAPYDVIVISNSLPSLPESFKQNLAVGGRLFAIFGKPPAMQATLFTKEDEDNFTSRILFETNRRPLQHAVAETFQF